MRGLCSHDSNDGKRAGTGTPARCVITMKRLSGFGVCIPPQLVYRSGAWIVEREFDLLGPRCFYNWGPDPVCERDGFTFAPMIWGSASNEQRTVERLEQYPGETWLLWNEPERPEQANIAPEIAAELSRDFLRMAWNVGREFQWAAPGVWIGPDSNDGLEWATQYTRNLRRRGIPSPNYWHVHGYQSSTVAQFDAGWRRFMLWYATWGSGAPVILSEVCADAAPVANQIAIMDRVAGMLRSGELTAAFWFCTHTSSSGTWRNAELCNVDVDAQTVALTPLGEHFVGLSL